MHARRIEMCFLVVTLALGSLGLLWKSFAADQEIAGGDPPGSGDLGVATGAQLGGEDRYLTHVSTDKPIYRPGEVLYVRGVVLHQATRRPGSDEQLGTPLIEIRGPKGDLTASGMVAISESVLGFSWQIPSETAGGEYTLKVSYPGTGYAPAERSFDVRAYRAPRLKSQIRFLRDGYGPGDEVIALLHVERAEGGAPAGARVQVTARVDGAECFSGSATVDTSGDCRTHFQLPLEIRRGEATLAMSIDDSGVVETASKTIPVLLQTVDLNIYPEGGELVAGLSNRVYFEAFTPSHKPADLTGVVLNSRGEPVAEFRSEHEGRGRFRFTPQPGETYELRIDSPSGIRTRFPLPAPRENGLVLSSLDDVTGSDQPVHIQLASRQTGKYRVTLSQRERRLDDQSVELDAGTATTLDLKAGAASGVLIVSAWDDAGKPLAERLVFRQPREQLRVEISADAPRYVPGQTVRLTVRTRGAGGQPVSAVVGLTVTDDSVLEMIDKREQAPRLPAMALLENDVRELADAHVYLDPENPRAPTASDLVLGTQGWRRFILLDVAKAIQGHGDAAWRAAALRVPVFVEEESRARDGGFGGMKNWFFFERFGRNELAELPAAAAAPPLPPAENAPGIDAPLPPAAARPVGQSRQEAGEREGLGSQADEAEFELAKLQLLKDEDAVLGDARRVSNDFVAVRVYAHQVRPDRAAGERRDFAETLFWHAGLKTNEQGEAQVEFALNDGVSSFRVFADAFSETGALGEGSAVIESVEPFYLEPKLPLEVTAGDSMQVPLGLVNSTGMVLEGQLSVEAHQSQAVDSASRRFTLPADSRQRQRMQVRVGRHQGTAEFTIRATAGPYADQVTRAVTVKPLGFPAEISRAGLLLPGGKVTHELEIPADLVAESLVAREVVYPAPLASLTEALERLIREPCGCFEQTSSTTYPLVMAQQYFMSHQDVDPSLVERSSDVLEKGYQRLIGFECKSGGYEWFGNDPGHDALTAYGLMEFTDMARVRYVDPAMLERVRDWLLAQRDGKGAFLRRTHTLHTWLAEPEVATSYNTWALLESQVDADLSVEVAWVRDAAQRSDNTYVKALAANVLSRSGNREGEQHLLDELSGIQLADGSLGGATTSVVGSGGAALTIETTALAALAWLRDPAYSANVERAMKYLAESCQGGRFGSTQSTVLALRAIVAYDQARAKPTRPGQLKLTVDGQPVGNPLPFTADTQGVIQLPDIRDLLGPGKHTVSIEMLDGSQMPYCITTTFHRQQPDSSADCKVHLEVALRANRLREGTVTEAQVAIVNRAHEAVPTPVAIIGIPGGLEVRHDQLKELVKEGRIAAYEVTGREVVLYWRVLDAQQRVELPLSLVAAVPGRYTAPASRAYLYYTDEHKHWVAGLQVEIEPAGAVSER